jgi:hypothetical protein
MAKSLGYGKVQISIEKHKLYSVKREDIRDLDEIRKAYTDYMEIQIPGWENSPPILELIALSQEVSAEQSKEYRHMLIKNHAGENEFQKVKQKGFALLSHASEVKNSSEAKEFIESERQSLLARTKAAENQHQCEANLRRALENESQHRSSEQIEPLDIADITTKNIQESTIAIKHDATKIEQPPTEEELQKQKLKMLVEQEYEKLNALTGEERIKLAEQWADDEQNTLLNQARRQAALKLWENTNKNWKKRNKKIADWLRKK